MKERIKGLSMRQMLMLLVLMWVGVIGNWVSLSLENYISYYMFAALAIVSAGILITRFIIDK